MKTDTGKLKTLILIRCATCGWSWAVCATCKGIGCIDCNYRRNDECPRCEYNNKREPWER